MSLEGLRHVGIEPCDAECDFVIGRHGGFAGKLHETGSAFLAEKLGRHLDSFLEGGRRGPLHRC